MPVPTNANELLGLVQKSGVVEEQKLRDYVKKLAESTAIPNDPAKLAGYLVRDGILTYFQAEQLLQGKCKRFTIGKYKVLEKLGSGGMGQVFLCEHKLMRRRVAVKVLPTAKAEDPSSLERFYREARAVAALDHPNIVRAYDIDQDENLHFLVMEYVDGTNLQDLIKKVGPLDVVRACHYIYGAAVGLQHAHEIGLVHRDIKPGNILVDRAGVVKILDMGLARFFHDEEDSLTKKYDENVLGTADYLAPEQALDSHSVDIRADIYSLGATFYFLLTGSSPFPEGTVAQKLIWHQNRPPRAIKSLRQDVPDDVVAILDRMMMKEVANRYQTPAEVMAALATWVATPIPPPSDREMPIISPAAGGNARSATTMVGIGGFSRPSGGSRPDSPTVMTSGAAPVAVTPPPISIPPVWESLDSETQTISRGDTDRTTTARPPRMPLAPEKKRTFLYLGLAIILFLCLIGFYFAFFAGTKPQPATGGGQGPANRRIIVSKAGGENTFATLREALAKAGPGDTIAIAEPKLIEPGIRLDRHKHRDLTIESATADGKPVLIEADRPLATMFDVLNVEGFRLRNVELDGRGMAEVGVQVSGTDPATTLEGVTVRGFKNAGFKLSTAAGEVGRPILFDHCRVLLNGPTQVGFLLFAANADTRRATIRNSRVEGIGNGTGIRIEGALTDAELVGNRFFNLDAAVSFAKPPNEKLMKGQITSNTVYQVKAGLLFDLTPPGKGVPAAGKFDLLVNQNYFAKTKDIAKATGAAGDVPGMKTPDNAHGPETGPGNVAFPVFELKTPLLLSTNPSDDDSKFLRFPGAPPEIGPNKVRVGAP